MSEKTIVYEGWMGRKDFDTLKKSWNAKDIGIAKIPTLFKTRGKKHEWLGYGWPPQKVRITIEDI